LLEVIVAFSLIAAALGGVTQVYFMHLKQTQSLVQHQRALRVLENEIERTRALPAAAITLGADLPLLAEAQELAPLPGVVGSRSIAPYPPAPELREITVRIAWSGPNGRHIHKSLTALAGGAEARP
jgi:hypothetical protein